MTDSRLQRYIDMAKTAGLTVERVAQSKHYKLYVKAGDGRTAVITAPRSGSDHRGDKNKLAQMRAFSRAATAGAPTLLR